MKIFFTCLSLIILGIANGLLAKSLEMPMSFFTMLVPSALMVVVIECHRNFTKKWKKPHDIWEAYCSEELRHFPVFQVTTIISLIVAVIFWVYPGEQPFVTTMAISITIAGAVMSWKELEYTA